MHHNSVTQRAFRLVEANALVVSSCVLARYRSFAHIMLATNSSVGPSSSNNAATLLTVNGIIPSQQINGQQGNRGAPILTPAYFPNTAFASFPVPFSGPTSVVPCITSPAGGTIFQTPGGHFPFSMTGPMVLAQPQQVLSGTPINYPSYNQSVSMAPGTTVVLTSPMTTDVCISSTGSLHTIQNGIVSIAPSTTHSGVNTNNTITESTPSIKCKPEVKPVAPLGSVLSANPTPEANLASLEKVDFHRDLILEAIDKLRERKARPDVERISCLLRRQHKVPPTDTQFCLNRLSEMGSIACVDYKGNMSYRNPSKWRKTAASAGSITNRPTISRRLLDAVRSLIPEGGDANQGFTLFQIEQALKQLKPPTTNAETEAESSSTSVPVIELTGSNLRMCLDREATYGKLAKLVDGRYVLDESGDKKRNSGSAFHLNRRTYLSKLPSSTHGTFGKPLIAPALDSSGGKPSYNVFSITPGRPIARRAPFTPGKRGRPPSIKAKKTFTTCSQQPILPAPSDGLMTSPMEKVSRLVSPLPVSVFALTRLLHCTTFCTVLLLLPPPAV